MPKTLQISPNPITYFRTPVTKKHKFFGWLPRELRFPFEYSFFLHDQIASLIVNGEQGGQFVHEVNVKKFPKKINDDQVMCWLEQNGYQVDACLISYKMATLGLLSDFATFIYESLSCARKLKSTVAYAMLRRPLKDNLYYLELMLADPEEFVKQFNLQKNNSITPVERISKERKIELISDSLLVYKNQFFYDSHLLWKIRYEKSCLYGLEYLFQKASHLVTSIEHYKTEPSNFNFIFHNNENAHKSLETYFVTLPILLLHTLYISLELIGSFSPFLDCAVSKSLDARNRLGFILWYKSMKDSRFFDMANYRLNDDELSSLFPNEILVCKKCNNEFSATVKLMKRFFKYGNTKCPKCKTINNYDKYYD